MPDLTPRLVATDLDGTIVRDDGTVSARTVAALARVERAGAEFVLVTGRPPRWIHQVAEAIGHRGLAICANGALVYDLRSEAVVDARLIEPGTIACAVERLRAAVSDLTFAVEHLDGFVFESHESLGSWDAEALGGRPVDGAGLAGRAGSKLLAFHPGYGAETLKKHVEQAVGDLVTITHSTGRGLIEMSALGVSKATALSQLCAERGIVPAEVIAFGDMPNDLPMLTWAGRSYAVANAHPDVLAAVDVRVAANNEDGVARALEDLFPDHA